MEEFNPPTSKISLKSDKRYQGFLTLRGKYVRMSLVHTLFRAISEAGLQVFSESHKLKKGKTIWLGLDFSRCLKEAATMLRTQGLIMPLVYDVNPSEVRWPLKVCKPYKKSFVRHYSHPDQYPGEEIDGWKRALEKICSRSDWSMEIAGGFEAPVTEILDRALLEVAKYRVGIDSMKDALIQKSEFNGRCG